MADILEIEDGVLKNARTKVRGKFQDSCRIKI